MELVKHCYEFIRKSLTGHDKSTITITRKAAKELGIEDLLPTQGCGEYESERKKDNG